MAVLSAHIGSVPQSVSAAGTTNHVCVGTDVCCRVLSAALFGLFAPWIAVLLWIDRKGNLFQI